ncbi:MAG TPA: DNA repair protein RecO [Thermoanaerobaculia bacterium]
MRPQSSEAFVLATYPLREKDRVVSFLTRDAGKKRGVAHGVGSPRSPFGGALEPMSEVRVLYSEKEGRELATLRSMDVIRSSFPISRRLESALLLSAFAESLQTFVSDSDPAEPFFRLARHVMDALFAGGAPEGVSAYFDVWVLKLSGLWASPSECAACGRTLEASEPSFFEEQRPGFVGSECRSGASVRLSPGARRSLRSILSSPLDPRSQLPGLSEISDVARRARRHFLGHELKSQRVLAQVLG